MFLIYFIVAGSISSIIAYRTYDKISSENSIVEMVGIHAFVLMNFLVGFLNIWVILPLVIHNWYLKKKIERVKKRISKVDQIGADINALKIYLELGYSKEEAEKAFLEVFGNNPDSKKRYNNVQKFIKKHRKNG